MVQAYFGSAGNPDAFYQAGHKSSAEMPQWLAGQNLTAYEYQCSRGINIREETARLIGCKAVEHGIKLSIHAPYYINLATEDPVIADNTKKHLLRSLEVAQWMGADTVVFHTGGPGKRNRREAMESARRLFALILEEADNLGLHGIFLAPETMGKHNQLGSLQEVLSLCQLSDRVIPAVDFGHLHAVSGGAYTSKQEYEAVFAQIESKLGGTVVQNLHIHFSRIEFTGAGEKRHWTFGDNFGPPHEPLIDFIAEHRYTPRIICESAGTQAIDAKIMQELYLRKINM